MAMTEQQSLAVATLGTGQAAVFAKGDDAPLLVKMGKIKDELGDSPKDDSVRDAMRIFAESLSPAHWGCAATLLTQNACEIGSGLAESREFQRELTRFALGIVEDQAITPQLWSEIDSMLQRVRRGSIDIGVMTRCAVARGCEIFADEWGARSAWPFPHVEQLAASLNEVLLDLANDRKAPVDKLCKCLLQLNRRTFQPYSQCESVCDTKPETCLYRHAAAGLAAQNSVQAQWRTATEADLISGSRTLSWEVARDTAQLMVACRPYADSERRAALCFSLQMLASNSELLPVARNNAFYNIQAASAEDKVRK
jgi:hypothetical protein